MADRVIQFIDGRARTFVNEKPDPKNGPVYVVPHQKFEALKAKKKWEDWTPGDLGEPVSEATFPWLYAILSAGAAAGGIALYQLLH